MSDTNPSTCPRCGAPLSPADAAGLCPRCLLAMNLRTRTMPTGEGAPSIPPPSPAELEQKFPQFEIIECLGRGGMGIVYKARQKALDRIVAIKILAGEWQDDPGFAERFEKEAKLLARLNHPNIVTIHDFGNASGLYYIAMEYIDGVNVRDLLRDGKLEPEQALAIIPPICEALQFAHDHGVVHRDIKPENILLDREGRVKIADFGIATIAGDAADRSGTPAYMAPEQAQHAAIIDHRADIYALGVVLYEMLTGERPGKDFKEPSRKVRVDVKIDEIVLRALESKPELRFQTAGEFKTVLETVAPAAALPGAAVFPPAPALSPGRADKFPKLALGTFLAAILGTPLLLSFSRNDEGVLFFGAICLLASLVFAIMSWRSRIGNVVLAIWAVMALLVLAYIPIGIFTARRVQATSQELQRSNARQAELAAAAARAEEEAMLPVIRGGLIAPPVEALPPTPNPMASDGPLLPAPATMPGAMPPVRPPIKHSPIMIQRNGELLLDGFTVSKEELEEKLKERALALPDHSVTIAASEATPYAQIQELMNLCARANISNIDFNQSGLVPETKDRLSQIELNAAFRSYEDLQIRLREAELQLDLAPSGEASEKEIKERTRLVELLRSRIEKEQRTIEELQKRIDSRNGR